MSTNTNEDENSLEDALSPIVNRLIDKNYETSQDKIASQMAPLIGSAIREQIKSQKDDVVDALYPVLGNMISRYVSKTLEDMLNTINSQIQSGLSFESLKRKATAKLKGVSESELLLSDNATANIRALLLIHKETGIVLAHAENPNTPVSEPEMLASMMTAIRSFVNDWIEQNSDSQELGEIEYGGNKIIIEASGYSYLAVIVEGSAYNTTYEKIRETLENVVLKYGDLIREFDGNLDKFENLEIYRELSQLIDLKEKEKEQKKKKVHPLIFLLPLLLLFWLGYSYYKSYLNQELTESIESHFYKSSQLTTFKIGIDVKDGTVTLSGNVPFNHHKVLAQTLVEEIGGVSHLYNELVVMNSLEDPMQISSNIAYLLRGLNAQNGVDLTYSYDYSLLTIRGTLWNHSLKKRIIKEIESIKNIESVKYEIKIIPPKLDIYIYFEKAQTLLTSLAQTELITAMNSIKALDKEYIIKLTSYSDLIGTSKRNSILSKKRVSNVLEFLKDKLKVKQRVVSIIKNEPPLGIDEKIEPHKARCIHIEYEKKENNASL